MARQVSTKRWGILLVGDFSEELQASEIFFFLWNVPHAGMVVLQEAL